MVIESYSDVLFYQVPLILFSYMTSFWLLNGSFVPILSDASSALNSIQLFPTAMKSLIMPFGEKFRVTPKGKPKKAESGGRFYLLLCIALFTLTLVGLLLNMDPLADRTNVAHFFPVATTLCFYNLIILTVMILLCIEQPKNREQERFPSYEKSYVLINGQKVFGTILDISLTGSAFRFNQKVDLDPTNQTIFLSIPHNAILDQIPCRIIRHSNGKVFLHFENINTAMKDELIRHVLTGRYDNAPERNKIGEILKNLFERVFLYEKKPYKKY